VQEYRAENNPAPPVMALAALAARAAGQLGVRAACCGGAQLESAALSSSQAAPLPSGAVGGEGQHGATLAPKYKAVTVDLFGTLLSEAIGEAKVYEMMMKRHGYPADAAAIDARYKVAYKRHKTNDELRYVGDGKEFWRVVVMEAVDCQDPKVFEDIYNFYELPAAWKVSPGAFPAIRKLRRHGIKTAVLSDFDTRCRDLVNSFGFDRAFHEIICSAEVGAEKPDPRIFTAACEALGVEPHEVLHIGDSERRDVIGAKEFGFDALLWGRDITDFHDLPGLVLPEEQ